MIKCLTKNKFLNSFTNNKGVGALIGVMFLVAFMTLAILLTLGENELKIQEYAKKKKFNYQIKTLNQMAGVVAQAYYRGLSRLGDCEGLNPVILKYRNGKEVSFCFNDDINSMCAKEGSGFKLPALGANDEPVCFVSPDQFSRLSAKKKKMVASFGIFESSKKTKVDLYSYKKVWGGFFFKTLNAVNYNALSNFEKTYTFPTCSITSQYDFNDDVTSSAGNCFSCQDRDCFELVACFRINGCDEDQLTRQVIGFTATQ